ncbi:ABC transporter ATP-binding protein [Streptomyces avicenniae]|uniref:ABC transporter ATP-binding protein n=1 Tax=Streptomyces avicenniae TaxID=500153 RepID=UPI00069BA2AD|nr:ABC transporter ATP-binding protein [Streptomyces avicenniae]
MSAGPARHEARELHWHAGRLRVLGGITLALPPGRFTGLVGPNGSGKSTLLRLLAGLRAPSAGHALLDGEDVAATGRRAVARRLAFVAQDVATDVDMTVREVVTLGRAPHRGRTAAPAPRDREAVELAMARTGVSWLADRSWPTLSGGERQRVNVARALAQEPAGLLLDEPTNHLDVRHRLDLLGMLSASGVTVVAALHELELAARYCDHLVLLDGGRVVASGSPAQVLTSRTLREVYQVRATVREGPDGRPDLRLDPLDPPGGGAAREGGQTSASETT